MIVAVFSMEMFSSVYAAVTFLVAGAHLFKLIASMSSYVDAHCVFEVGHPSVAEERFAKELCDYVLAQSEATISSDAFLNLQGNLHVLFSVWRGGFFNSDGKFVIYVSLAESLDELVKAALKRKLVHCYVSVALSGAPPRPSLGKWTPLFKCMAWLVIALTGNVLPTSVRFSFQDYKTVDDATDHKGAVEAFQLDVDWRRVQSKAKTHFDKNFGDVSTRTRTLLLAVVIEPLFQLHRFYMHCSLRNVNDGINGWPPLLNAINPKASIIHAILQYYSGMLADPSSSGWLLIIMAQRGFSDFRQWHQHYPGDVEILRQGLLCAMCSLERRLWQEYQAKYRILSVGDLRFPKEERSAIAAEIVRQRQCCCRPGLSRGLRAHGLRGADGADRIASALKVLVDKWWVMVLIAFFVRMSIAVVENMHKRHRLFIADGKTSPETLLAMSICSRL